MKRGLKRSAMLLSWDNKNTTQYKGKKRLNNTCLNESKKNIYVTCADVDLQYK